jgi:hypothetical protein
MTVPKASPIPLGGKPLPSFYLPRPPRPLPTWPLPHRPLSDHNPEFHALALSYCEAALNHPSGYQSSEDGSELPPGFGNPIYDPTPDMEFSCLDHIGATAVNLLIADPAHRVLKRGDTVSIVLLSDGKNVFLRNCDVADASPAIELASTPGLLLRTWTEILRDPHRYRHHPQWDTLSPTEYYGVVEHWYWEPIPEHTSPANSRTPDQDPQISASPLPAWRQAQRDALASAPPAQPTPWPAPLWDSESSSEPSHEPDSRHSHRKGLRTTIIRAHDPDNLLRHIPRPALRSPLRDMPPQSPASPEPNRTWQRRF